MIIVLIAFAVLLGAAAAIPPSPDGTIVWQAGSPTMGRWVVANTYQCGIPVVSGARFTFALTQKDTSCGRNQANPTTVSGDLVRLSDGATYMWRFRFIDGVASAGSGGMGPDSGPNPEALIWQIHGYREPDTPCTSLNFANGAYYAGQMPGQEWAFMTCRGAVWFGRYLPGEQDDWKIVATISASTSGETKLFRNGVLVVDDRGANYHHSMGDPWWNFGPYKWRWELPNGGGSRLTQVSATIDQMVLTRL
ncbi:MAG: heparin lyase I family protein [Candidatus Aquilonibacter sp.]